MDQTFVELKEAIIQADSAKVDNLLEVLKGDLDFESLCSKCIDPALDTLCANIINRNGAVPELLMGLKQVQRISDVAGPQVAGRRGEKILMGVVEGDIHDMGKNVIRDVCTGYGYEVIDLGKNVTPDQFTSTALAQKTDIACLSTMMSTTIEAMERTIVQLKNSRPGIRVLIGGAFMDNELAVKLQADGYAENASVIMNEIERILH
ncbi:cobalamin B12-binding domain-containing protein [Desulfosediminicola flagellatus]|uniref:cobalamin B12-binding domain-containing protein n=1 Tax=Desulfosediminicola flagellatus TaxID=2569541 RepID=UPI0010ABBEF1|nr:cobalamin-dependent protein [Desulfosediminicola flagellatus]